MGVLLDLWMLCILFEMNLRAYYVAWMFVWVACLLHSSPCVFPFLRNLLSSSSTATWHILNRFLSIELSFSGLDRSSTDSRSIEDFSYALCLLNNISIASRSIEISRFLLNRISTASRSIKISRFLLDTFSITSSIHRDKFLCSLST